MNMVFCPWFYCCFVYILHANLLRKCSKQYFSLKKFGGGGKRGNLTNFQVTKLEGLKLTCIRCISLQWNKSRHKVVMLETSAEPLSCPFHSLYCPNGSHFYSLES